MEEVIIDEVVEEYSFKHRKCDCGFDLSNKVSSVTSLYRAVRPMGTCPGCGKQMILNAQPVTAKIVLDYEVEAAEVVGRPARSSRRR